MVAFRSMGEMSPRGTLVITIFICVSILSSASTKPKTSHPHQFEGEVFINEIAIKKAEKIIRNIAWEFKKERQITKEARMKLARVIIALRRGEDLDKITDLTKPIHFRYKAPNVSIPRSRGQKQPSTHSHQSGSHQNKPTTGRPFDDHRSVTVQDVLKGNFELIRLSEKFAANQKLPKAERVPLQEFITFDQLAKSYYACTLKTRLYALGKHVPGFCKVVYDEIEKSPRLHQLGMLIDDYPKAKDLNRWLRHFNSNLNPLEKAQEWLAYAKSRAQQKSSVNLDEIRNRQIALGFPTDQTNKINEIIDKEVARRKKGVSDKFNRWISNEKDPKRKETLRKARDNILARIEKLKDRTKFVPSVYKGRLAFFPTAKQEILQLAQSVVFGKGGSAIVHSKPADALHAEDQYMLLGDRQKGLDATRPFYQNHGLKPDYGPLTLAAEAFLTFTSGGSYLAFRTFAAGLARDFALDKTAEFAGNFTGTDAANARLVLDIISGDSFNGAVSRAKEELKRDAERAKKEGTVRVTLRRVRRRPPTIAPPKLPQNLLDDIALTKALPHDPQAARWIQRNLSTPKGKQLRQVLKDHDPKKAGKVVDSMVQDYRDDKRRRALTQQKKWLDSIISNAQVPQYPKQQLNKSVNHARKGIDRVSRKITDFAKDSFRRKISTAQSILDSESDRLARMLEILDLSGTSGSYFMSSNAVLLGMQLQELSDLYDELKEVEQSIGQKNFSDSWTSKLQSIINRAQQLSSKQTQRTLPDASWVSGLSAKSNRELELLREQLEQKKKMLPVDAPRVKLQQVRRAIKDRQGLLSQGGPIHLSALEWKQAIEAQQHIETQQRFIDRLIQTRKNSINAIKDKSIAAIREVQKIVKGVPPGVTHVAKSLIPPLEASKKIVVDTAKELSRGMRLAAEKKKEQERKRELARKQRDAIELGAKKVVEVAKTLVPSPKAIAHAKKTVNDVVKKVRDSAIETGKHLAKTIKPKTPVKSSPKVTKTKRKKPNSGVYIVSGNDSNQHVYINGHALGKLGQKRFFTAHSQKNRILTVELWKVDSSGKKTFRNIKFTVYLVPGKTTIVDMRRPYNLDIYFKSFR